MFGFEFIRSLLIMAIFHSVRAQDTGDTYFGNTPLGTNTPEPLDLETYDATTFNGSSLQIQRNPSFEMTLCNKNSALYLVPNDSNNVRLTGSLLYNSIYKHNRTRFYWNGDNFLGSYGTVDYVGYTVNLVATHYKESYGSFEEARKNRDGCVNVVWPVAVAGRIANPKMEEILSSIRSVQKGGCVQINSTSLNAFTPPINDFKKYIMYGYQGTYFDVDESQYYDCTTTFVGSSMAVPTMSMDQFECSFLEVLTESGDPNIESKGTYFSDTKIVECKGVEFVDI